MCGIAGYFRTNNHRKKTELAIALMHNRGKDATGFFSLDDGTLGHALHSVVGCVKQPIVDSNDALTANCEIYNWKELAKENNFSAKNDSDILFYLLQKSAKTKKGILSLLDKLDGVYAFAFKSGQEIILARDILGVKPLWYFFDEKSGEFAFASERKALLLNYNSEKIFELNPRTVFFYNIKSKKIIAVRRKFFVNLPEHKKTLEVMQKEVKGLIVDAVAKRIPDKKFGILFSGGIDSVLIAYICKQLGADFVCYTAALDEKSSEREPSDLIWARKAAKILGFELKVARLTTEDVHKKLKIVVPLIEDNNVVKCGVALTLYVACEEARKDGVKVIFTGLGAEEIFAGYSRHKNSQNVNDECVSGLIKTYERDTYRDDVISMNNNIELRIPFFDRKLVEYALKIPGRYKLNGDISKLILRQVAEQLGLPSEFAMRKKDAAQYGSKFDWAIDKLAKQQKNEKLSKSEYLKQFYDRGNVKLAVLFSGGKDSCLAMNIMHKQNYSTACLITIKSKNKSSYMFHTPNIDLTKLQAEAMELALIEVMTKGKKETELLDLKNAMKQAIKKYAVAGIVTGAIFSNYQRTRIEKVADSLGLKIFSPLWHMEQESVLNRIISDGFEVIISAVAADGLGKGWLGRKIDEEFLLDMKKLNLKIGINLAGEGGEYESLVLNGPMFKKKIIITDAKSSMEDEYSGVYEIKDAHLV